LETHLRDTVTELQRRGLNDQESFWLARKRIGQPKELREEFVKTNPERVWRERVFWMTLSLVGSYVFTVWEMLIASWSNQSSWSKYFYLVPLFALVCAIVMFRRGLFPNYRKNVSRRKLGYMLFAALIVTFLAPYFWLKIFPPSDFRYLGLGVSWLSNAIWPMVMILVLLLAFKREGKVLKRSIR
jgi:hypothetical protein